MVVICFVYSTKTDYHPLLYFTSSILISRNRQFVSVTFYFYWRDFNWLAGLENDSHCTTEINGLRQIENAIRRCALRHRQQLRVLILDLHFPLGWSRFQRKNIHHISCVKLITFNDSGFAGSIGTGTSDGDHILGRHRLLMTYPSIRGDVENGAIISDKRQLYLHRFRNILFWCLCESCLCEESGCNGQGNEFHNMLIPF